MKRNLLIAIIVIFCITGLILAGLSWLALGIITILFFFILLKKFSGFPHGWEKHPFMAMAATFLATVLFAILLRVFVFEVYSIPTGSMENTLIPGDVICVEKLSYGPVLPRSPLEIPWVNVFFLFNKKAVARRDTFVWNYHRLHGFSRIRRGDVVVFRYPDDPDEAYIKRCVALPGDTLMIRKGKVMVNGLPQSLPPDALMEYRVWYNDTAQFQRLTDSLGIDYHYLWPSLQDHMLIVNITAPQAVILTRSSVVDSIRLHSNNKVSENAIYAGSVNRITDAFGPLVIPAVGMHLTPDSTLFARYGRTFLKNEGYPDIMRHSLFTDSLFIVKGNYYFMMGDNRDRSNDSRMWGLVPETLITGKARCILWSGKIKHFKWKRMMKRIR